jgi:hypothetical protein
MDALMRVMRDECIDASISVSSHVQFRGLLWWGGLLPNGGRVYSGRIVFMDALIKLCINSWMHWLNRALVHGRIDATDAGDASWCHEYIDVWCGGLPAKPCVQRLKWHVLEGPQTKNRCITGTCCKSFHLHKQTMGVRPHQEVDFRDSSARKKCIP